MWDNCRVRTRAIPLTETVDAVDLDQAEEQLLTPGAGRSMRMRESCRGHGTDRQVYSVVGSHVRAHKARDAKGGERETITGSQEREERNISIRVEETVR